MNKARLIKKTDQSAQCAPAAATAPRQTEAAPQAPSDLAAAVTARQARPVAALQEQARSKFAALFTR
jgi:TorA maturation chaperone TorD